MCGIVGIIGAGDRDALARMTASLAHRGPDGEGMIWWERHRAGLGHRRLAIIDLSEGGRQPMSNPSGRRWITYNGELYNYRELRDELKAKGCRFSTESDTEVLLAAYEQWGEGFLARLNGIFSFAIYEPESGRVFAARDRMGVKPFYYYWRPGVFVFASEIKALLVSGVVPRRPDLDALRTPARFQISPDTGFEEIRKLSPGHTLAYDGSKEPMCRRYWALAPSETHDLSPQAACEHLDALLDSAVQMQMVADVPIGLMLSGGLDSSIIGAYARKRTTRALRSFTIRFTEEEQRQEKMPDDSRYARQLAEEFGFDHQEFVVEPDVRELLPRLIWHLDEPLADSAVLNTFIICEAARKQGINVLLTGVGGDEIFGGYRKHKACLLAQHYLRFPSPVRGVASRLIRGLPVASRGGGRRRIRWAKRFLSFAALPPYERYLASDMSYGADIFASAFSGSPSYRDAAFYSRQRHRFEQPGLSYLTSMCWNDTEVFLPEHNLLYSDKAAMAAGVEGRPPLTDHRVAEFMFGLPPEYRIRRGVQKFLLKKVAERHLPRDIIYRPKAPFAAPLRAWVRGPLSEMIDDILSDQAVRDRGLYRPEFVRDTIADERSGIQDNAMWIWQLLTVELWFQTFFEQSVPALDTSGISWNEEGKGVYTPVFGS